jgi:MFS family permease
LSAIELAYTGRERSFVTWSAILGYAFDFYNLIIMAFLLTQIQRSLGMTLPQTGLIVSMTLTGSVIGGVGIGWLGDKIGRKNALLASLALLAAGSILSAFAWDFASLLAFRFITGIGVGGEWGVGMVLLNEVWRSERRGFGSCVVQAMSAAGTAIAVLVATFALTNLSDNQSWRAALLFGGLPIFLMIFIRAKMPESRLWSEYERLRKAGALPPEKAKERSSILEILLGASLKYFVVGTLMCGAYIISYQAISIFMPTLMIRDLHANPGAVRTVTLIWSAFSATGLLLAGLASDHFGRKRAIGVFGPWYSELFPVELRSTGASVTFTAGRLIGSAMPYLVPVIAALLGDLFQAMMFGVIGAVLSLLFALLLPETAGRKFAIIEGKEHG